MLFRLRPTTCSAPLLPPSSSTTPHPIFLYLSFPVLLLSPTMGRPPSNWLAHLQANEDAATSPAKVELALIDARFARKCEVWWDDHKDSGEWHTKAVKNYKSASATFWDAYEDETTPHIYKALAAAAKAASARASELEDDAKLSKVTGDGNTCYCDVCREARRVSSSTNCPVYNPRGWHYCSVHRY